MTQKNVAALWPCIAALALGATACIGTPESSSEEDVAVTTEALGGFTELVNVGNESPLDIGPTYTVFKAPPQAPCGFADIVFTQTGARVPVPALPGCPNITAADSQSAYSVTVADRTGNKIYQLKVQTDASGNPVYSWFVLKDTSAWNASVWRMITASSLLWVYTPPSFRVLDDWTGYTYGGGSFTGDMLAADVSVIYRNVFASDGMWELQKVDGGNSVVVLARSATSFAPGFSFDSDYFYWIETGSTNKLHRLPKAGGSISTVRSSSTVIYHAPVSNGSMMYWLEQTVSDGSMKIRRQNLSNGNIVSTNFPFTWFDARPQNQLRLLNDAIYFTPYLGSPTHWSLYRTQL